MGLDPPPPLPTPPPQPHPPPPPPPPVHMRPPEPDPLPPPCGRHKWMAPRSYSFGRQRSRWGHLQPNQTGTSWDRVLHMFGTEQLGIWGKGTRWGTGTAYSWDLNNHAFFGKGYFCWTE